MIDGQTVSRFCHRPTEVPPWGSLITRKHCAREIFAMFDAGEHDAADVKRY
jgi:hypothetical protein